MTRRRSLGPMMALAVLLSACTPADNDPDGANPAPAASTNPSASTAEPESAPSPAPTGPTNPCDLLDRADYADGIAAPYREQLIEIPSLEPGIVGTPSYVCEVHASEFAVLSFGYALDDTVYGREFKAAKPYFDDDRRIGLDGIGAQAFYADTIFDVGHARLDTGPSISVNLGFGSYSGPDNVRILLERLAAAVAEQPITVGPALDVGEGCPSPRGRLVKAVVGEVSFARGSRDEHGVPQCHFFAGDNTVLRLGASYVTQERYADEDILIDAFDDFSPSSERVVIDPPPGIIKYLVDYSDTNSGLTVFGRYPRQRIFASVSTDSLKVRSDRRVLGGVATLRALAQAWFTEADPQISQYRYRKNARQPQTGF